MIKNLLNLAVFILMLPVNLILFIIIFVYSSIKLYIKQL